MKSKTKTNAFLMFLILILVSSICFGASINPTSWSTSGADNLNSGSIVPYTNAYKVGFTSTSDSFNYTDTLAFGSNTEPITYDIDGDGYIELIAFNNNVLNIYGVDTNSFELESSKTFGGNILTASCLQYCENSDCSNTSKACVLGTESGIYTITKDSNITTIGVSNSNAPEPVSAINCNVFSNVDFSINRNYCYYVSDEDRLVQFVPQNGTYKNASSEVTEIQTTAMGYLKYKPMMEDIDNDGNFELVDTSFDGSTALTIRVYEMSGIADQTLTLDTGFSADGLIDINTQSGTQELIDSVLIDFENDGNYDVCAYYRFGGTKLRYGCVDHNGATILATTLFAEASTYISGKIIVSDTDGDGNDEIFLYYVNTATERLDYRSFENSGGTPIQFLNSNINSNADWGSGKVSGSSIYVNNDNYSDIVLGSLIIFGASDGFDNFSNTSGLNDQYNYVFSDINKDGQHDIIGQKVGGIEMFTQGTGTPAPLVTTITLNTAEDFSGIYGSNFYPSGTCVDTNVTFRALECLFGFDSSCTYENTETSASERLNINCSYQLNELTYNGGGSGDYDNINPNQWCQFTETGVYAVQVGFEDTETTGSQVTEIIYVNVLDSGCNQANQTVPYTGATPTLPTGETATTSIETAEDFFDIFSYGSSTMKFVFGLIIALGMAVMGFSVGQSIFMSIIMGVAGLILATILGLIPLWVIISMAVLMALPLLIKTLFSSNG